MKLNFKLLAIIAIAFTLRVWQLGFVPVSPDWDEVALGYNAYSVLKTGRDEYGIKYPLSLRSYDDFKPPLYMYLTIPSISLFGLNTTAVRLPSALAGTLSILGVYLFMKELILLIQKSQDKDKQLKNLNLIPYICSLLLTISPWHLQFSRIAFEANIGLSLNIWIAYLLLAGLHNKKLLIPAAILSALSLYAYHSERVFVPLLIIGYFIIFRDRVLKYTMFLFIPIIVGFITLLPLIGVLTDKNSLMRLRGTSSLSDQTGLLLQNVRWLQDDISRKDFVGQIVDNRRFVWVQTIISGYLSHFSYKWWFINGDNPRHHAPEIGMLYLWELPFLLIGFYVFSTLKSKAKYFVLFWFIISPIAASLTTELPHAIRTLVFLPTFQIFVSFGIFLFLNYIQSSKNIFTYFLSSFVVIFILFNILFYFKMYYVQMDKNYSDYWQYGYKEAVQYTTINNKQYSQIVVSTKLEQPYMFFLFYLKYDPTKYLREGGTTSGGFAEYKNKFDKYVFRPINWVNEKHDGSVLYIGKPGEIQGNPLKTIYYLNGTPAMVISN